MQWVRRFCGEFALNNVKAIDKGALILYLCNVKEIVIILKRKSYG